LLLSDPQIVEAVTMDYVAEVPYIETREQYQRRILGQYDWDAEIAYKVMMAESRGNPKAFNPEWHKGCQGSLGAMQMSCIHHRENPTALFDFEFNVQKAYELYSSTYGDGSKVEWYPWGACHDGKVYCGF